MKNKGFTLVELLAVIAILAILVIVAMPNVLGMFNQAKVSSFTTEVQKLMDVATTTFTKDALLNSGKTVYYSSESNATLGTKELDMSGNKKNYFIEMDRNGDFKRVVVYDSNYCYDVYYTGTNGKMNSSKSKLIVNKIEKTSVVVSDVWESGNDSIGITMDGNNYIVNGCEGVITVEGKDTNVYENNQGGAGENGGAPVVPEEPQPTLITFTVEGKEYQAEEGMTWAEWVESEYNTDECYLGESPYGSNISDIVVYAKNHYAFITFTDGVVGSSSYLFAYDILTIEANSEWFFASAGAGN